MSSDLEAAARRLLAAGRPTVVVEVARARGSVPRGSGTRMLVTAASAWGSIGGGHLEWQALAAARDMLAVDDGGPRSHDFPLGPSLGQCCGGAVTLRLHRLDAAALAAWPPALPRFHLQLHGAGHVGRAIAAALAPLQVQVDWIDSRDEAFPARLGEGDDAAEAVVPAQPAAAWPPHIRKVCVDAVEGEVADAPAGAFYLVLTHQHDLDLRIVEAVLRRDDFGFLGLIGSQTKRRRFEHRLEQRGFAAAAIGRMVCPIGLPGIEGKEPEVIAAAVVAQLLQVSSPTSPP